MSFCLFFNYAKSASISSKVLPTVSFVLITIRILPMIRNGTARIAQVTATGKILKSTALAPIEITADTLKKLQTPIIELLMEAGEDSLIISAVRETILL